MAKIIIRRPEEPSKKQQFHKELNRRHQFSKLFLYGAPFVALSVGLNIYFLIKFVL